MKTEKKLFPLYTDLTQKKAVVIGGGKIAARRIKSLLGFVGELVVIAPDVQPEIQRACKKRRAGVETEAIREGRFVRR